MPVTLSCIFPRKWMRFTIQCSFQFGPRLLPSSSSELCPRSIELVFIFAPPFFLLFDFSDEALERFFVEGCSFSAHVSSRTCFVSVAVQLPKLSSPWNSPYNKSKNFSHVCGCWTSSSSVSKPEDYLYSIMKFGSKQPPFISISKWKKTFRGSNPNVFLILCGDKSAHKIAVVGMR